jgi:predicted CopG family antitoxin
MANYIVAMATTIQISKGLLEELKKMKMHEKESYEEIIWDLIEDRKELSAETQRLIEEYEAHKGKTVALDDLKKKLNIK